MTEHPVYRLEQRSDGGFTLSAEDCDTLRVGSEAGSWRLTGSDRLDGLELRRLGDGQGRFQMVAAGGEAEAGRSSVGPGADARSGARDLVMADGRVYRMLLRGPEDPRFELTGWETTGPYLTARPEPDGWSIVPEPACAGLDEIQALLILFAAEILDTGDPGSVMGTDAERTAS